MEAYIVLCSVLLMHGGGPEQAGAPCHSLNRGKVGSLTVGCIAANTQICALMTSAQTAYTVIDFML